MAQRRNWEVLDDTYRARLERAGITQSAYESGESLSAARGHAHTPERPIPSNEPVPKRYQKWFNSRYKTPIRMLTEDGDRILVSVSPKARSLIASHWNAVKATLYGQPAPRAWWYKGSDYIENMRSFATRSVRGSELNDDGSIEQPQRFMFMTNFEDIVDWTYNDTANFGDIYNLQAA